MKNRPLTLLATAILLLVGSFANAQKKNLELEDIWASRKFFAAGLTDVRSMKDGLHYSEMTGGGSDQSIVRLSFASGKVVDTLFSKKSNPQNISIDDYSFSENEKLIIFATESEPIYRHSTKANHYIFDRTTGKLTSVSENGKQQYATVDASGKLVAFVRDNNLFIKDLNSGAEKAITSDGAKNSIINGATDWVYEEEFSFDQGYQWSPDGRFIAFYRFDETHVKQFNLTYYSNESYPKEELYKYPKAGAENSKVEIRIYDLQSGKTVTADVNKEADQYIPRIKWTSNASQLCVMRMNRLQNLLELQSVNAIDGRSSIFFKEENQRYIEVTDNLTFLNQNKGFIWSSTMDGYHHLYLYDMSGKMVKQLTKGSWDVTDFYGYDAASGDVYFQAAINSPMEKGVYKVGANGKMSTVALEPGTCSANFSEGFKYRFITNSTINSVPVVKLYDAKGKFIRLVKDNKTITEGLANYHLSTTEFFQFTTSEDIELNGWMIKPANFDPNKKYPVIQYMYGGPGSQTVKNEWLGMNWLWFQLLAQKGYLIVSVDNRGTGARGEAFNKCIYKQLGHLETIDQMEVAKWLGKQTYVDASRIGAWGWSYGGYMTSLLITKGADLFKTCIAVAPVTNWKFYDSIYTERYLQTPQQNPDGYEKNSPVNFADKL
ncbi:MAG: S9 family peptidase, partial [Bacteroidota bacterium]